jgi:hypothetical protein
MLEHASVSNMMFTMPRIGKKDGLEVVGDVVFMACGQYNIWKSSQIPQQLEVSVPLGLYWGVGNGWLMLLY